VKEHETPRGSVISTKPEDKSTNAFCRKFVVVVVRQTNSKKNSTLPSDKLTVKGTPGKERYLERTSIPKQ
jgi:hypothetical protein